MSLQPYTKIEPFLCSSKCQILMEHEAAVALTNRIQIPALISIILEYVTCNRTEEIALAKDSVTTSWNTLVASRNVAFIQRALRSDIFSFAIHGIEARLSQDSVDRFNALVTRITDLYPKSFWGGTDRSIKRGTISPLDLPRVATATFTNTKFHPYFPLNWGEAHKDLVCSDQRNRLKQAEDIWSHPDAVVPVKGTDHPLAYMPPHDQIARTEFLFLAPYRIGAETFCPLLAQQFGDNTIAFDGHPVGSSAPAGITQFSYLPIAEEAVNSSSAAQNNNPTADWALMHYSYRNIKSNLYNFEYSRIKQYKLINS